MYNLKQKKLRNSTHLDGTQNFRSYADFKAAFDEYCRKNAAGGDPLTFVCHKRDKLKKNTFENDPLDEDTINRFVYSYLSLKCIHDECYSTNPSGPYCRGGIIIRYNRQMNVLSVTSFFKHSNHHTINDTPEANLGGGSPFYRIVEIARKLPDNVLVLLEQMCKMFLVYIDLPGTENVTQCQPGSLKYNFFWRLCLKSQFF